MSPNQAPLHPESAPPKCIVGHLREAPAQGSDRGPENQEGRNRMGNNTVWTIVGVLVIIVLVLYLI